MKGTHRVILEIKIYDPAKTLLDISEIIEDSFSGDLEIVSTMIMKHPPHNLENKGVKKNE